MLLLFLPTPHSRFLVLIFLTTKRTTNECLLDAKENIYSTTPSTIFGGKELYRSTKNNPQALDQKHQKRKTRSRITLIGTSELLFFRTWCQQIQNEWQRKITSRNEVEEGMETDLIKVHEEPWAGCSEKKKKKTTENPETRLDLVLGILFSSYTLFIGKWRIKWRFFLSTKNKLRIQEAR